MDRLRQDLRFTFRTQLHSPLFTFAVLATLAIGIGANTAIFSFVDALLLRPLPYPAPDRVVSIWQDLTAADGPAKEWFTPPDFGDLRERNRSFDAVAAYGGWGPNLTGVGEPEQLSGATVSAEYFQVLGVQPALGRTFRRDEELDGSERVVVLNHRFWQRRFDANPAILGSTISLNGEPWTVIGVMPDGFRAPIIDADIWQARIPPANGNCGRGCYVIRVLGRLQADVPIERANADLAALSKSIGEQFPETSANTVFTAGSLKDQIVGPTRPALLALLGAVGMVLLIACVNIANLLLARGGSREREVAIRTAMGAGRSRLVRQMLTESVLLSAVGGMLGVLLSLWGVQALRALSPEGTPRLDEVGLDATALGFAALLALLTGIAFGIVPALQLSRADLSLTLRETGGLRAGSRSRKTRSALVVAEVALALMLLAGAGLMLRSFVRLQNVDPGFNPENVLTANLLLPRARYDDMSGVARFYGTLVERVGAEPDVISAGASTIIPLLPGGGDSDTNFGIEGKPAPASGDRVPVTWYRSVTPDYMRTMGMRIVQGRAFEATDRSDAPGVVVINRTLAAQYWPGENPVGQRVILGRDAPSREIVGVLADVKQRGMDQGPVGEMYFPLEQTPARRLTVVMRTAGPPLDFAPRLRAIVHDLDPELPVAFVGSMDEMLSQSVAMPRLFLTFFAFFAVVAMLLASVGIYGVTAFAVNQRKQEIGIRIALGARQADVLGLVVRQAMMLVGIGVLVGLAGALALSHTLTTLLFDLSPTDPLTFASIVFVLAAVAFVASWMPARRAARQDPLTALRTE